MRRHGRTTAAHSECRQHQALVEKAPQPEALRHYARIYFQNDVVRLIRAGSAMIGLVGKDVGPNTACPGRFDVYEADLGNEFTVDYMLFAKLARYSATNSRPYRQRSPNLLTKRIPWLLFLGFSWRIVGHVMHTCFQHLDDSYRRSAGCSSTTSSTSSRQADSPQRLGTTATSLLGAAIESHLADIFGGHALLIDSTCPVQGKKPDALWCGSRFGVVVEVKSEVDPISWTKSSVA